MSEPIKGKHDIFISYSTKNKNVADAVVADFEQHGIKCWYAPRDILPGEEWVTAITSALEVSKALVLIYTDESNNSRQVMNEIAVAFNAGITIVPFRLSNEQMSSELEYYLTRVHWLDAVSKPLKKNIVALREYIEVIIKTPNRAVPSPEKNEEEIEKKEKSKKVIRIGLIIAAVILVCLIIGGGIGAYRYYKYEGLYRLGHVAYLDERYDEAIDYYEKAAANGNPKAMWALGDMYYDGVGVDMNEDAAFKYYLAATGYVPKGGSFEKVSEGITDEGMLNRLGLIYFYNYEYEEAAFFFTENANINGNVYAMANAAMAYENMMDWQNAYIWYKKAIDAGHQDADSYEKRIQIMINDDLVNP